MSFSIDENYLEMFIQWHNPKFEIKEGNFIEKFKLISYIN